MTLKIKIDKNESDNLKVIYILFFFGKTKMFMKNINKINNTNLQWLW